jgi:ubiquinone/menaquinone biosynthesis C-methylase UbiE
VNRFHRWYCSSDRWATRVREDLVPWVLRGVDLGDQVLEVGPGPGLTTVVIMGRVARLTALEVDAAAAAALERKLHGSNVTVVSGDGAHMPFDDGAFTGAICCTMLHHVPSPQLQDQLLGEVFRVLRPGATFAGSDSRSSLVFRVAHLFDTMVLVDPEHFEGRLEAAGFREVRVSLAPGAFRFSCRKP